MNKKNPLDFVGKTQEDNRKWWEDNPMTYQDWDGTRTELEEDDPQSYRKIDSVFFSAAKHFAHPGRNQKPFGRFIDFEAVKERRVLEIGCGHGSHAELLARAGAQYTGIDITEKAVRRTSKRFKLNNLSGDIIQMDAEKMAFPDESFDVVWSWGVIHHSHSTEAIVDEIYRVLRPHGVAKIMVYHKNSLSYYFYGGLIEGVLQGKLLKMSLYEVNKRRIDGAFASHYTSREAKRMFGRFSKVRTSVFDQTTEVEIPFFGKYARRAFPRLMCRLDAWLLKKWGWFLYIEAVK